MTTSPSSTLKSYFGFDQFRPGQEQTIHQLLAGKSSLAIFPTGSGKSLCYQLSALHLPNLTLVISPLLALIKDQLEFLASKGIPAASIDSTLAPGEAQRIMADVRSGKIKLLMVSVERFKNERFRQFIESIPLSMLVVDEAHCISEWGHNFRPDYLKLPLYRKELNIPLVLLLTATATKKVKLDMARKFDIAPEDIVQTGFYRNNLDLTVKAIASNEKNSYLIDFLKTQTGSGIVYVTLQQSAQEVADLLREAGLNAVAYHAGLKNELRQQIQADFMSGKSAIIVATIAFGMGIDKSDIRFVIHHDLPKSIENYSQEIGRAGRDGNPSQCLTLANLDGLNTVENFVYGDTPELSGIQKVLEIINKETQEGTWEYQLLSLSNSTNIRQLPMKTLLVQLELANVLQPMYAYFADFRYKFLKDPEQVLNIFSGERRNFLNTIFQTTSFKRVWGVPSFENIMKQSGCDRNRIVAALEYLQEKNCIMLETKGMTEVFRVDSQNLATPRLAENLYDYFSQKETSEIKRVGNLIRFFELDKCLNSNLSRYFDDQEAPLACGHCSPCRSDFAKLFASAEKRWPSDGYLLEQLQTLKNHLQNKSSLEISTETYSRFLMGLNAPLFTRNKVRKIEGFGSCEKLPYLELRAKVIELQGSLI